MIDQYRGLKKTKFYRVSKSDLKYFLTGRFISSFWLSWIIKVLHHQTDMPGFLADFVKPVTELTRLSHNF